MYRQQAQTLSLIIWLHNTLFTSEKLKQRRKRDIRIIPSRVRRRYFTVRSPFAIAFPPSFRYRAHYIAYTKPPMRAAVFPHQTVDRGAEGRSQSERRSAKGGADTRDLTQTTT